MRSKKQGNKVQAAKQTQLASKPAPPKLVNIITADSLKLRDVTQHYGKLTLQTAMQATTPTIRKWAKMAEEGKGSNEIIIQGIANLFIGTSLYFGEAIPQAAAESVVIDMMQDYELGQLKLEDLVVITKELKEKDINRSKLTPNILIKHIRSYYNRRQQAAILHSQNQSLTQKNNDTQDIATRIKGTIALPDAQGKRVDRTRASVKKFYK
ncbi:hypothetical protein [Cellulophaga lytica]|uniref:hypothetical protein n=1 Tax=Cellulophaga lytica TaxID=979 RepID=UPI003CE4C148